MLQDQIIFVALLGRKQRELWESTKAMIPLDFGIFVDSVILDMIQVFFVCWIIHSEERIHVTLQSTCILIFVNKLRS